MVKEASSRQGGECCLCLQNCEDRKTWNRDTICEACHDFAMPRTCFSGCPIVTRFWENVTRFSTCWERFQDKVDCTLGRTHQTCHDLAKRDTILTVSVYYLSVSAHFLKVQERELQERKTWEIKGGKFTVKGLWLEFSWVGKHCKHLGWVKIIECLVHWWDWENE